MPIIGKNHQAFEKVNTLFAGRKLENGRILPFFEFGTAPATYLASPGWSRRTAKNTKETYPMFALDASNRLFAAAFSVVISAAFLAYAIVPASPSLMA
jgi:hypothetical protein